MDKKQIQLRIEELKFQKEDYSPFNLSTYLAVLFGLTSTLFVLVNYFGSTGDLVRIFWSLKIYFSMIFLMYLIIFFWAVRKRRKIKMSILNNYDLLFGRREEYPEVWKRSVILNKTNQFRRK